MVLVRLELVKLWLAEVHALNDSVPLRGGINPRIFLYFRLET